MKATYIQNGFRLAALANIAGVLLFSKLFTNRVLNEADPIVFSNFGLLSIVLWGLAYLAIAKNFAKVPNIVAVFAVEKLVYVGAYAYWMSNNAASIGVYLSADLLAGVFLLIYGINDFAFMVFFGWVYYDCTRGR